MNYNFQIAIAIRKKHGTELRVLDIHQSLRDFLYKKFSKQLDVFISKEEEIDFTVNVKPEYDEHFRIRSYPLPEWLEGMSSRNIPDQHRYSVADKRSTDLITSVIVFTSDVHNNSNNELMLFQNITKSSIITPSRLLPLISDRNLYFNENPGFLRIGDKIDAVYLVDKKKLLFDSFYIVRRFLPLDKYYRIASDPDIHDVVNHELFECENINAILSNATQSMRRRFAKVKDSKILDEVSTDEITEQAEIFGINVEIRDGKIMFPFLKSETMDFLKLISEEVFLSIFGKEPRETTDVRERK